jgi:hypothetical protein
MSQSPVESSRSPLFRPVLLFAIVGFAAISATLAKVSLSAAVLVLVAFAEAGLIIFGLLMVRGNREASAMNQENE